MGYSLATQEQMDRLVDFRSAREFHLAKDRRKRDKRMSLSEAIGQFVQDGDILPKPVFLM